jgi:colanic acid biosynthesis glycosyl transferase WcaI
LSSAGMFHSERGLRMVDRFCRFVYQQAARIVVIAPGMKERLVERGVAADRVDVVYNWSNEHAVTDGTLSPQLAHELGMQGKFNILYAGNLGTAQALDAVLQAAARVRDELPDVQFVLVGDGVEAERLRQVAAREQLHNVIFQPRMPVERIGEVMQLADVLLVHLKRDPLFEITIPAKTQAYLAAGKPILVGVAGDAAALVARAGAGIACTPEDPESIAQAAREFRAMTPSALAAMGRSAREFYGRTLSFAVAVDRYEGILSSVCRR